MVGLIENITTAFVLGFLTPLTAVCVLPLYPAFLIYLSNQIAQKENQDKVERIVSANVSPSSETRSIQ